MYYFIDIFAKFTLFNIYFSIQHTQYSIFAYFLAKFITIVCFLN